MFSRLVIAIAVTGTLTVGAAADDDDYVPAQADTFTEYYKTFDQVDLNNDGKLDVNELRILGDAESGVEARSHQHGENVLERLDQDGDDFVSRKEFQEGAEDAETDDNWW